MIRVSLVGVVLLTFAAIGSLIYSDVDERVHTLSTQRIEGHLGRAKEVVDLKLQMASREITDRAEGIALSGKVKEFLTHLSRWHLLPLANPLVQRATVKKGNKGDGKTAEVPARERAKRPSTSERSASGQTHRHVAGTPKHRWRTSRPCQGG